LAVAAPVILMSAIKQKQWLKLAGFGAAFFALTLIFGREYLSGLWDSLKLGQLPFWAARTNQVRPDYNLWQHLVYTTQHTFQEVLPWYWGVFRWLSLTLPRWVNQVMMRLLVLAGVGLVIKFFKRKFEPGFWILIRWRPDPGYIQPESQRTLRSGAGALPAGWRNHDGGQPGSILLPVQHRRVSEWRPYPERYWLHER